MNWQLRRELLTNVAAVMGGALSAALNLDFTTLTPATMATAGVTFSRASMAGQYDSTGKWTWCPNNQVTQSQTIDNAAWTADGVTVTANSTTAPDGTSTADTITENTANSLHRVYNTLTGFTDAAVTSFYVKFVSCQWVFVEQADSSKTYFDIQNGTVGNSGTSTNNTITSIGSGWYRISVQQNGAWSYAILGQAGGNGTSSYVGTSRSTYVWGAQIERTTYETTPRTYNPTVGSVYYGPRFDYNPSTLAAKGLLIEEARTNLIIRSDAFDNAAWMTSFLSVTANAVASPDGTTNAETLTATNGTNQHFIQPTLITATAAAYTSSVYLKKGTYRYVTLNQVAFGGSGSTSVTFDLQTGTVTNTGSTAGITLNGQGITDVGNGWYRAYVIGTWGSNTPSSGFEVAFASGATPSYDSNGRESWLAAGTETFHVYGAQMELGAFATSYIPTTSASATRAADIAQMTGASFSNFYNATAGTWVSAFDTLSVSQGTYVGVVYAHNNVNGTLQVGQRSGNLLRYWIAGGSDLIDFGSTSANTLMKIATAYTAGDYAACQDGGTVGTSSDASSPGAPTLLTIGSGGNGPVNGHIKTLAYYNSRLPNATLQMLTT